MKKRFTPFIGLLFVFLSNCSTTTIEKETAIHPSSTNSQAFSEQLRQTLRFIDQKNTVKTKESLAALSQIAVTHNEKAELIFTQAIYLNNQDQPSLAVSMLLEDKNRRQLNKADPRTKKQINEFLVRLYEKTLQTISAARLRTKNSAYYADTTLEYQKNHQNIWQNLNKTNLTDLKVAYEIEQNAIFKDWLGLSIATTNHNQSFKTQIDNINQWNLLHPTHPASMIPPLEITELRAAYRNIPQKIAVILPFEGKYENVSNAIRDGIMQNYYDQKISRISFYNADPEGDFIDIYHSALESGADLVIGPLLKNHLKELTALSELPVQTIALNASKGKATTKNLIQFSLSTKDEIDSLIQLATTEQHHRAILLAESSDWAKQNMHYFKTHWEKQGNTVVDIATFTSTQSQSTIIRDLLNVQKSQQRRKRLEQTTGLDLESEPRRRQDIDMAVVFAKPHQALSIPPLFNFYYAQDLPIYSTSSIFIGFNDKKNNQDLDGVKITEFPLIISESSDIPDRYQQSPLIRMFAFGKDAFAIGERASSLNAAKNIHIQGATGLLSLKDQKIHRQTQPAVFENGLLRPVQIMQNM